MTAPVYTHSTVWGIYLGPDAPGVCFGLDWQLWKALVVNEKVDVIQRGLEQRDGWQSVLG